MTLCVSTRNAARMLPGCIESVCDWVREIVIVDMGSTDETLEIARSFQAKVIQVPPAGWAEPGRQAGIDAATQEWMLVLDADERAAGGLQALVSRCVGRAELGGLYLPRQNFQFGWWVPHSGIWPDWQLRLFRRERTTWSGERTHVGPSVQGAVEHAPASPENAIVHHGSRTIRDWAASMNGYTDLEADRLTRDGRSAGLVDVLAMPLGRFAELYLARRGFRGGRYGLAVALMSLCYWLLAALKAWERRLREHPPSRDAVREPATETRPG